MIKAFKYLSYMLVGAACAGAAWSCTDENYTMPQPNISTEELVEGVAFTVEHDAQNPNIIHLTSLMPAEYQVAWVTPQGRKTGATATLSIPFDGTYEVQMGIDTRGGYVWSEPYEFTIDDFCADFVDHYLWKRISGGVGQSKTWQLDLGVLEDGTVKVTGKWKGPHWFFTNTYTWDNLHAPNESESVYANFSDSDPWEASAAISPCEDWYWAADYPGNSWMCDAQNYGYITFDLINGANVTVTDADGNVVGKGTYMLDTDAHTVTLSDVYPLETTDTRTHERFLQLLYLSDDAMMLMAPSEGVALNYVTKEFFENYTEPVPTEITLPEGWYEALSGQLKYCSWNLDPEMPFDWYDLGGEAKNGFNSAESYPAEFKLVSSTVDDFSINFCSPETGQYTISKDGNAITGKVDLRADGTLTLDQGLGNYPLGGSVVSLTGNNFKIIKVERDSEGRVEAFVFGLPETDVNGSLYQYLGYRLVANFGGAAKAESYKAVLSWNDTSTWTQIDSTPIFVEDGGTYTIKLDAPYTSGMGDPCLWLDVKKILKTHLDCSVVLNDIKVDGTSISFDDSAISKDRAADSEEKDGWLDARRYICNPWGLANCFTGLDQFHATKGFEVTFTVHFSTGDPFLGK